MSEKSVQATEKTPAEFKETHVFRSWKYESPFMACRFDPTGRFVFACAQDQSIQRWDLETDKHVSLIGHDSWSRAIDFSPDGKRFYSAGYEGRLLFWLTADEDPKPIKSIKAHDGWVRWLSVSANGQLLATGGNDNLVKVWNAQTGELVQVLSAHKAHVYSTFFHPDGKTLLSGDLLGQIHQWNVETGKLTRSFDGKELHNYNGGQRAHYGGIRSMSLSPDGKYLACSGLHKATNPFGAVQEPLVVVFNWESGEKAFTHEADGVPRGIAWRVVFHETGVLIGSSGGASGGFLIFWKSGEKKEMHKVKLPNTVLDFDLHSNQLDLVTAHHDRQIRLSKMLKKPA